MNKNLSVREVLAATLKADGEIEEGVTSCNFLVRTTDANGETVFHPVVVAEYDDEAEAFVVELGVEEIG